jgi:hypothetical protein
MNRSISRSLAMALAIIGLIFGALGALPITYRLLAQNAWQTTDATVESISFRPLANNPRAFVSIKFRYVSHDGEKPTQVAQALLPGQGEKFVRDYSVGTHHRILLDPDASGSAELPLSWDALAAPVLPCLICLLLLVFARHFWSPP